MSRKTKKLMWSVPIVAAFAVVGALAAFIALMPNQAQAQAIERPGMPTDADVKVLGPASLELTWEAPTTGGAPTGYRIDYSEDGDTWYSLDPDHDSPAYNDAMGLTAVEKRYYRIFAINSAGSSKALQTMGTTAKSEKAAAPTGLTATAAAAPNAQTQIDLAWTAPSNPVGAPVKMYKIRVSTNGRSFTTLTEKSPKDAMCDESTSCAYSHKKLTESQQLWYRVIAINYPNGEDASPVESDAANAGPAMTEVGALPSAPLMLRAGVDPNGNMWLYWDKPDTSATGTPLPGAPVEYYYIYGSRANSAADPAETITALDSADTTSTAKVSSLHRVKATTTGLLLRSSVLRKFEPTGSLASTGPGITWSFQVMAANSVVERKLKNGTWSGAATAAESNGIFSTALTVDNSKDLKPAADSTETTDVDHPDNAASDLTDDLLKKPTLRADVDNSVENGRTQIKLSWSVAGDDATDKIYRLEYSKNKTDWMQVGTDITIAANDGPGSGEATHPDLTAGTTYHYRVFATHNDTRGDSVYTHASNVKSATTASAGTPDKPDLTNAQPVSETEIELSWTAPGEEGDEEVGFGKITGYKIETSTDGKNWDALTEVEGMDGKRYTYDAEDGLDDEAEDGTAGSVEFLHSGLRPGMMLRYRVSTVNNAPSSARTSAPSNIESATSLKADVEDDPNGLLAMPKGATAIDLLWNARAEDATAVAIAGFRIQYSDLDDEDDCAGKWEVLKDDTGNTNTSYTDMPLAPETGRCYRVAAINEHGDISGWAGFDDDDPNTNDKDAIAMTADGPVDLTLKAPTEVTAESTSAGALTLNWKGAENATSYLLIAVDMSAARNASGGRIYETASITDGAARTGDVTGLIPGRSYLGIVVALKGSGDDRETEHGAAAPIPVQ